MRRYDESSLGYYFLENTRREDTVDHERRDADGKKSVETLLKLYLIKKLNLFYEKIKIETHNILVINFLKITFIRICLSMFKKHFLEFIYEISVICV